MHHIPHYLIVGLIAGPFLWLAIFALFVLAVRGWKQYFKGLKIFQYPAMLFIIIGTKLLTGRYCHVMTHERRLWYSPKVSFFEVKD